MPLTQERFPVQDPDQRPRIAEGWYIPEIKNVTRNDGANYPYYKVEFAVPSKEDPGRVHNYSENFSTAPDKKNPDRMGFGMYRFSQLAAILEAQAPDGRIDTSAMIGKRVGICFRHTEKEDQYGMNKIVAGISEFRRANEVEERINYLNEHGRELG